MSGKPYSWVDDFLPSRRRKVVYSYVEHAIGPRFPDTKIPVPSDETPCAKEPDLWFVAAYGKAKQEREAIRLCGICWMRPECRAYGLEHPQEEGVWGGLTRTQRTSLRTSTRTTT